MRVSSALPEEIRLVHIQERTRSAERACSTKLNRAYSPNSSQGLSHHYNRVNDRHRSSTSPFPITPFMRSISVAAVTSHRKLHRSHVSCFPISRYKLLLISPISTNFMAVKVPNKSFNRTIQSSRTKLASSHETRQPLRTNPAIPHEARQLFRTKPTTLHETHQLFHTTNHPARNQWSHCTKLVGHTACLVLLHTQGSSL